MTVSETAFLQELEDIIHSRLNNPSDESYTADLIASGSRRIAQKVGEEGVELALAAAAGDKKEIIDEASDLIYHVLVLLADQDLRLKDVCDCLQERHNSKLSVSG